MLKEYFKDKNFHLYLGDSIEVLRTFELEKFDMIFADPPYLLSNGGITCQSGKMVSVNKGDWDKSNGFLEDMMFTEKWLELCKKVLKKNGTIWISGTFHIIYKIGYILEKLDYKIINDIVWYKPNAPPNLSCRYFTHSHEIIIWAKKSESTKHKFNYELMKEWNYQKDKLKNINKQMRSVWSIPLLPESEKEYGKHPTQKPLELLNRIINSCTSEGDWVLDPFIGSGTTGIVCNLLNRKFIGIDIQKDYLELAIKRYKAKNKPSLYYPKRSSKITNFI